MATFNSMKLMHTIAFIIVYLCISNIRCDKISNQRLCADRTCEIVISRARTLARYKPKDPAFLAFDRGEIVNIYSKSAGSRTDLWGGELNGKRGYFPRSFVREYKVEVPNPQFTVETEEHVPLEEKVLSRKAQERPAPAASLSPVSKPEAEEKPEEPNVVKEPVPSGAETPSATTTDSNYEGTEKASDDQDATEIADDTEVDETDIGDDSASEDKAAVEKSDGEQPHIDKANTADDENQKTEELVDETKTPLTKPDEVKTEKPSDDTDVDETDIADEQEEASNSEVDETDLDDMDFDEEPEDTDEADVKTKVDNTVQQIPQETIDKAQEEGHKTLNTATQKPQPDMDTEDPTVKERDGDDKTGRELKEKVAVVEGKSAGEAVEADEAPEDKSNQMDKKPTEDKGTEEDIKPEDEGTEVDETEVMDSKEEEEAGGSLFGSMFNGTVEAEKDMANEPNDGNNEERDYTEEYQEPDIIKPKSKEDSDIPSGDIPTADSEIPVQIGEDVGDDEEEDFDDDDDDEWEDEEDEANDDVRGAVSQPVESENIDYSHPVNDENQNIPELNKKSMRDEWQEGMDRNRIREDGLDDNSIRHGNIQRLENKLQDRKTIDNPSLSNTEEVLQYTVDASHINGKHDATQAHRHIGDAHIETSKGGEEEETVDYNDLDSLDTQHRQKEYNTMQDDDKHKLVDEIPLNNEDDDKHKLVDEIPLNNDDKIINEQHLQQHLVSNYDLHTKMQDLNIADSPKVSDELKTWDNTHDDTDVHSEYKEDNIDKNIVDNQQKTMAMDLKMKEAINQISARDIVSKFESIVNDELKRTGQVQANDDTRLNDSKDLRSVSYNDEADEEHGASQLLDESEMPLTADMDDEYEDKNEEIDLADDIDNEEILLPSDALTRQSSAVFGSSKGEDVEVEKKEVEKPDLPKTSSDAESGVNENMEEGTVDEQGDDLDIDKLDKMAQDKVQESDKTAEEIRNEAQPKTPEEIKDENDDKKEFDPGSQEDKQTETDALRFVHEGDNGEEVVDEDIEKERNRDAPSKPIQEMEINDETEKEGKHEKTNSQEESTYNAGDEGSKAVQSTATSASLENHDPSAVTDAASSVKTESSQIKASQIQQTITKPDESSLQSSMTYLSTEAIEKLKSTPTLESQTKKEMVGNTVIDGTMIPMERLSAGDGSATPVVKSSVMDGTVISVAQSSVMDRTVTPVAQSSVMDRTVIPVAQSSVIDGTLIPMEKSSVIDGTMIPVDSHTVTDESTPDNAGYVIDGTTFPPEYFGEPDNLGTTSSLVKSFPSIHNIVPTLTSIYTSATLAVPQQTVQPTSTATAASIAGPTGQVPEVSAIVESVTNILSISEAANIETTATLKEEVRPLTPQVLGTSFSFASESRDDSSTTEMESITKSLVNTETLVPVENVTVRSDMVQEQVQPSMDQGVYLTENFLSRKPLSTGSAESQTQGSDTTTQTTEPASQKADMDNGNIPLENSLDGEQAKLEQQKHQQQKEDIYTTPPTLDPYSSDSVLSRKIPDSDLDEELKGSGSTSMIQSIEPMLKTIINVLPPSLQSLLEQEPLGLSPTMTVGVALISTTLLIVISCLSCLCKGEKKSAKQEALEIIQKLEDKLFINTKEKENLEDELQMKNKKIEELESDVHTQRSTSGTVETEINTVRLHNEALKKQVSALQQEVTDFKHEVGEKKRDIKDKADKIRHHEAEVRELQTRLADVETLLNKTQESVTEKMTELQKVTSLVESLTQQVQLLETRKNQLEEEASGWSERVTELSERVDQQTEDGRRMQEDLAFKENELEVLRDCFLQVKAFQGEEEMKEEPDEVTDLSEKLKSMMDVSRVNATLRSVEEERDVLKNKLQIEVDSRREMEDQIEQLKRKIESNHMDKMKSERQSQEAQTRLEVLSKYFKEREAELSRQLGEQEVLKNQNINKLQSSDSITIELKKESEAYKAQVEDLKMELTKAERDFRSQIAANEKKAHESWLATRAAERECKEARHECGMLRQKLTDLERKLMQAPPPGVIRPITRRGAPPPGMLNGPPPPPPPERPGSRGSVTGHVTPRIRDDDYRHSPVGPDRMPPPPDRRLPPGIIPRPPLPPHINPQSPPPYAIRPPYPADRRSPPNFDRYPPPPGARGPRLPPPPGSRGPHPPHLRSPPLSGPPSEYEDSRMGQYPRPPGQRDRTQPHPPHQSHV